MRACVYTECPYCASADLTRLDQVGLPSGVLCFSCWKMSIIIAGIIVAVNIIEEEKST